MKVPVLLLLLLLALFTSGCVTEPAPEEPTMYGSIGKAKKQKAPRRVKPIAADEVTAEPQ